MLLFMTTSKSSFGQNKILRLHVITKYMTKTENDLYTEQLHYLTQSQCTMYNVQCVYSAVHSCSDTQYIKCECEFILC